MCLHGNVVTTDGRTRCGGGWHNLARTSYDGWYVPCSVGSGCYYSNLHGDLRCLECQCISGWLASQSSGVCPVVDDAEVFGQLAEVKRDLAFASAKHCHVWNQGASYADCYGRLDEVLRNRAIVYSLRFRNPEFLLRTNGCIKKIMKEYYDAKRNIGEGTGIIVSYTLIGSLLLLGTIL